MTAASGHRQEARGVHFRTDYPDPDPQQEGRHVIVQRKNGELTITAS